MKQDCLVSLDSIVLRIAEASTVANKLKKMASLNFTMDAFIYMVVVQNLTGTGQVYALIDNKAAIGTQLDFPVTNVLRMDSYNTFFPEYEGMRVNVTEEIGFYSFSTANGNTAIKLATVWYRLL